VAAAFAASRPGLFSVVLSHIACGGDMILLSPGWRILIANETMIDDRRMKRRDEGSIQICGSDGDEGVT
jgi:hypothetical protein